MDEIDIALKLKNLKDKDLEDQLAFNFECEVEMSRSSNSKPMSGEEYKQKIAQAYARYIKRRELHYATNND